MRKGAGCFDLLLILGVVFILYNVFLFPPPGIRNFHELEKNKNWQTYAGNANYVFVYFYSESCGACRKFKPTAYKLAGEYGGWYRFVPIDLGDIDNRQLGEFFRVRGIPAVYLVKPKAQKFKYLGYEVAKNRFFDETFYKENLNKFLREN